ncbi:hypothetical protein SJI00_21265 [Pseudomonas sp. RP23018S]|uniref:hypothetical protein n=1 Tax=Pseudomonas sp. RP23018S TaxID=3096037 RepID=UPI002ACA6770|nr:hypothetical protein [Pseudomonas sp. RP23018S]MDZ5605308.1 hypothetical protein [Pseudomonas sp. RP23018S]
MTDKKPGRTVDEGKPGAGKSLMTLDQFHVVVQLLKGKPGTPANDAACLVLVEGLTKPVAAARTGATRSTVHDAVTRYYDAFVLIEGAWPSTVSVAKEMSAPARKAHKVTAKNVATKPKST